MADSDETRADLYETPPISIFSKLLLQHVSQQKMPGIHSFLENYNYVLTFLNNKKHGFFVPPRHRAYTYLMLHRPLVGVLAAYTPYPKVVSSITVHDTGTYLIWVILYTNTKIQDYGPI